ncbi:HAMP domain-containing protein [Luedemannella flava]
MADLLKLVDPTNPVVAVMRQRTDEWWRTADHLVNTTPGAAQTVAEVAEVQARYQEAVSANAVLDKQFSDEYADLFHEVKNLRTISVYTTIAATLAAAAVAFLASVRITRRIVRPLDRVVAAVDRFGRGDLDARVTVGNEPREIAAVGASVNQMADQVSRLYAEDEAQNRRYGEVRRLGMLMRRDLAVAAAMRAAAQGLGEVLGADHVVVRLIRYDEDATSPAIWSVQGAVGDPAALSALPVDWLAGREEGSFVADAVPATDSLLPEAERPPCWPPAPGP